MTGAILTDEALLDACQKGDARAWEEFVSRFSRLIYWSIRRTLQDTPGGVREDLVADIFQDVFRKIFEKRSFEVLESAAHIKKYLVVVSAHAARDRIKSRRRADAKNVPLEDTFADAGVLPDGLSAAGPAEEAMQNEKNTLIAEVMSSLGEKERACLEFAVEEGMTHQAIGLLLGIPQDTVSSIIRRAKDKIKEKLIKKGLFE